MADYEQEQEMEVEALQAILMDDIKEIDPSESGLSTTARCFQILLSPQDDDFDESAHVPVQLALIFAHTEKYPDEPPLLNVKSVRGIKLEDLASLKEKLDQEATDNLGMAMVYTLATSAKEWLSEKYGQNAGDEEPDETEEAEEEVIVPHGEAVTIESFMAWRERFEAELALQRAKLMPESALTAPKEKKLTGRQYFESGRHAMKGASTVAEEEEEEEEDIEFDDDFEDDEEDDSGGEEGEGLDAEYQEDEEDEEDETPWPKRRTNPAAVRSRQRRYEEDDDYLEELEEDEEVDDYLEDLDEEEEAPRPKRMTKCGGRGQKGKLPRAAEGSNRRRHEEEDMDFYPDLDEEEEEDMDFDPEVEDEAEEDEEEEDFAVSHNRKVRVNNTVRRKPASKHRHRNKKNSTSKVSRRKVDSAKAGKATPVRRRRKRSVIDHYEEDEDFIVEDQVEVNRQSRKRARVGRQIEVDHPVPVVEEDIWPTVESDTSDFDFVTSDEEPEDVEPAVVEPVRVTVRKGRKKRISGLESSSDSEFHVSDKELGDFRETEPLEAQPMLPASPRRISVTRNGEGKGKEKKEPEESGRPTCGICLSEEQKMTMQGVLNCCSHYFCFACIIEWSRVESRCPLCKRRFTTITKSSKADLGLELIKSVIRVEKRDQIYQPTEDEIRRWLDPYENVVCIECNQGGDDSLMLLCDICDSSAHTYCVGLGREVPEGSWYCGGCRVSGEGPSYPRSPVNSNSEEFGTFERSPLMNPRQTFRGIDLNVSPREIPGETHLAESQASTMGVLTPSGRLATYSRRRQINEMISILLSRPRPAISPEVGHSGVQHSGSVSRIEPNHRNFRAPSEANTSQHSGSVPRTEPDHRNLEAASETNTSQTLARRRRINEWISILLSRPRTTINPEVGHSGVPRTEPDRRNFCASLEANTSQLSGSVPRTEPNHRNFHAPSEANTSQTLLDDIQNQHTGFPLVQAQSNFAPCISVDGNNFQQTEGVKSNVKHMCSISPR